MLYLFDTHCHLQDRRLHGTLQGTIEQAQECGVRTMVCCGTCEEDWSAVLELAQRYSCIIPALGLHPWFCADRSSRWRARLYDLLCENPNCAVGEIGLDFAYPEPKEEQLEVFREQLFLAAELGRPVSVHCRNAWGALLTLLRSNDYPPHLHMVIHSYSGSPELVPQLESFGVSLSFSGSVTREKNRRVRRAVQAVRSTRLLIETDAPDLSPAGFGRVNTPSSLPLTAQTVALLRRVPVDEIAAITAANAAAIFMG